MVLCTPIVDTSKSLPLAILGATVSSTHIVDSIGVQKDNAMDLILGRAGSGTYEQYQSHPNNDI